MIDTKLVLCFTVFSVYLVVVRRLRYRRRDELLKRYPAYRDPKSLGRMTLEEAFAIQLPLAELEFPLTFSVSIFFALFKVCSPFGVPDPVSHVNRLMEFHRSQSSWSQLASSRVRNHPLRGQLTQVF